MNTVSSSIVLRLHSLQVSSAALHRDCMGNILLCSNSVRHGVTWEGWGSGGGVDGCEDCIKVALLWIQNSMSILYNRCGQILCVHYHALYLQYALNCQDPMNHMLNPQLAQIYSVKFFIRLVTLQYFVGVDNFPDKQFLSNVAKVIISLNCTENTIMTSVQVLYCLLGSYSIYSTYSQETRALDLRICLIFDHTIDGLHLLYSNHHNSL